MPDPTRPLAGAICWRCGAPATLSFVRDHWHYWSCPTHADWNCPVDLPETPPTRQAEDDDA